MDYNEKQFGAILKDIRKACRLTQEQLGEMIGVSANAIGQYERGQILPTYATLGRIINALNVDANLFFAREPMDYPDEAKWVAQALMELSPEEKSGASRLMGEIVKILDRFDNVEGDNP